MKGTGARNRESAAVDEIKTRAKKQAGDIRQVTWMGK